MFKGEGEEVGLECRHSQIKLGLAGCGENALMGSGGGAAGQMRSHPRELPLCHVGGSLQGTGIPAASSVYMGPRADLTP